MNEKPRFDWFGFWVHFSCGAILGALLGISMWVNFADNSSWRVGIIMIFGGAILIGIIAGSFQEGFWEAFKDWLSCFWS
ncbi:MAG: hypothetical protein ACREDS_13515 [Limisphaerales bacterium]